MKRMKRKKKKIIQVTFFKILYILLSKGWNRKEIFKIVSFWVFILLQIFLHFKVIDTKPEERELYNFDHGFYLAMQFCFTFYQNINWGYWHSKCQRCVKEKSIKSQKKLEEEPLIQKKTNNKTINKALN